MSRTRRYRTRATRGGGAGSAMDSLLNGIMALAFLAGLVLLGFYVAGRMKKDAGAKPRESARTSPGGGGRSSPPPAVPAPGLKAPNPSGPSFEDLVVDLNMAVIAKEICRLRGEGGAAASKQGAAQVAYADLMVRAGDMTLADRILEPADEFISVDDRDLARMGAGEAGDHLTKTFQKVSAGGLHRFHVRRGAEERVIFVHFPKDAELPGARLVMPEKIRITDELAQEIQKKFFGLGTYYQQTYFTPEERALVAQCLSRSEATPEEYAFLTRRVIREAGPQVNAEQNWFRTRLQALEQAMESAVVPDVVVTGEGRKVIGRILEEAAAHVRVEAEYGRITVYRNDVREVHKSKEIREEFERRLKAAARYPEQAYPELLTWTRDWGLPAHREYVAYLMLLRNPADRLARLAAGYHQGPNGRWEIPEAGAPPPQPAAQQLPTTRKELQASLEALGFVLVGGKWLQKVPWSTGINTLYQSSDVKWMGEGVAIMTAREGESVLAVMTGAKGPASGVREMFLCPTGTSGTVSIGVTAPGEIVECKVRASSVVLEREQKGRVEVALMPEGGKLTPLYAIDGGGNGEFYDVTEHVKGKRRFTVSARLTTTRDKFHTYSRFLPSLPDTQEVFWVRGAVLRPAPEIDKSWENAR